MKKSLLSWTATVGLVGSTLIGSWLSLGLEALALPKEQILQKLGPVPVFTIADSQGSPLVAAGDDNAKVAGVFISQQDAQNFVEKLKKDNPDLGGKVKVVPVSLGEVYELAEANDKKADGLNFAYVPMQNQVESAKKLLSAGGKEYQGGVPLFVAKGGAEQGYLTIKQKDQEVIPFFFEKQQVEDMVSRFKEDKPDLASTINIEVVVLEGVISALEQSDDNMLSKIIFWPSEESIEFLRNQPDK